MAARAVLLALLPITGVFGFSNTIPFVAWSSQSSDLLTNLSPGARPNHGTLLESIVSSGDICLYDAIVVIDHPGLHSSDLRTLQPSCRLAQMIKEAPTSRQLPHVGRSLGPSLDITEFLSNRCGSSVIDAGSGSAEWSFEENKKHVITMSLPPVEGSARYRKSVMAEHEPLLSSELDKLASLTSNHLVIYSGSHIPLERRQLPPPSEFDSPPDAGDSYNSTFVASPQGGILKNYQLLTPGLIITLIVVFFIIVPVLMLGITALSSIQSSLRSEAPKGYNAQEKKTQ
ncbi:hypothetical protein HYDPIDRAFT_23724 [Hydnomerulius pinastri MD-312]|nr:hypothetical protein HYDPIDRAFT_23724 [Hydnomerulius pinastri MD-312]